MTNKEDVVRALVQAGADVNYGSLPPVTIAASLGRVISLNLLIEHNVDLSAEVRFGPTDVPLLPRQMSFRRFSRSSLAHRTALDLAENFRKTDVVAILRSRGARKGHGAILSHHH
jgi:hypothetical protein